jgi:hypothetical protein
MTIDQRKVDLAVEAVRAYYRCDEPDDILLSVGYCVGGSFHIWASDGNEGQIDWCTEQAAQRHDMPGVILGCFLKTLTDEEEYAALAVLVPCCWGPGGECNRG